MNTTVIIPNYNGMQYLPGCIESLNKQTDKDFEILVVDNGSSDGSVKWLEENHIRHIPLNSNMGFAGGVNVGIRAATTEFVLLLNNDTVAEPEFLATMKKAICRSSKIFAVSAMMIKASDHSRIDSAGDGMTILGWAYQRGTDEPVEGYKKSGLIFSACAGAAIYRKNIFDEIGLFDEMHFAYLEDMDLSYRAKLAGYYNYYCSAAKVYHIGSATSGSKYNPFKVRLSARNNIYVHYKNQPGLQLILNFLPLLLGIVIKAGFFLKIGFFKDYLAGVHEGLTTCLKCKRTPRAKHGILSYLAIEGEMIVGMFEYTMSFIRRHI